MRIAGERSFLKSTVVFTLALGFLLLPGPSFRAADTLPAQLSDEAFWKIIEDFSEDGGTFTSENFSSNELGYQALIPKLQAIVKPGSVYMGVGPEQNFQYIAGLKPKIAFIIDIRRQNMIQHLMYKAAFEMSANRADFLSIIFSRKRPEGLSETSTPDQLFEAYRSSDGCRPGRNQSEGDQRSPDNASRLQADTQTMCKRSIMCSTCSPRSAVH